MTKIAPARTLENYEIRLIFWETREVPCIDGNKSDIYFNAIYYPDGLSSVPTVKNTDVHYGCTDGRAVFNYRIKFLVEMPVEFPRLKL